MNSEILYSPGSVFGPCEEGCSHKGCTKIKEEAAQLCIVCDQPIDYNHPFVREDIHLVHLDCTDYTEADFDVTDQGPTSSMAG